MTTFTPAPFVTEADLCAAFIAAKLSLGGGMTLKAGSCFPRRFCFWVELCRSWGNPWWRSIIGGFLLTQGYPVLLDPSQGCHLVRRKASA